ncbi:MAG: beta-lactamase family protein [Treponema sp.]|jgi:CubicO group peptidase (beta-lactamase class C family)|nr:beta-lactamase family protein [Treponema sp.]
MEKTLRKLVQEYRNRNFFPSASIRVFNTKGTLCALCVGDAGPDTVFDLASLTKIASAAQILFAVFRGLLSLESPVLGLLPALSAYPLLRERLSVVTIRKLLTHSSGIAPWYPFYAEPGGFAEVLSCALEKTGPVEGTVYSDINFMLLGMVLEALYRLPLDQCLKHNLTTPLELGKMAYRPPAAWDTAPSGFGNPIEEDMCAERGIVFSGWRPHEPLRGEAHDGNAYYFFKGIAGHAGLFADALSCEKLCRLYLETDIPLFIEAQKEQAPGRGLGWQVGELYPDGCGHTGFTGTSLYISRKRDIGVAALTNRLFCPAPNPNPLNEFRNSLHRAVLACI